MKTDLLLFCSLLGSRVLCKTSVSRYGLLAGSEALVVGLFMDAEGGKSIMVQLDSDPESGESMPFELFEIVFSVIPDSSRMNRIV